MAPASVASGSGAGLREARLASEVATRDGVVVDARRHITAAIAMLGDALELLQPPAS